MAAQMASAVAMLDQTVVTNRPVDPTVATNPAADEADDV